MASDMIAPLPNRGVVSVTGADAAKLLQGLITNDMDQLTKDGSAIHAGLLSPQGKILFDFFVVRTATGILIDVARDKAGELIKRLTLYKLRADVLLSDVSEDYRVFALWGDSPPDAAQSALIFVDPRLSALGLRVLADAALVASLQATPNVTRGTESDYDAHRIALGVPEGGKDYDYGDAYPHDAGFDIFRGVSFTKGCFVGQEVVARMQNKSIVRKRVVRIEGSGVLAAHTDITLSDAPIGRVGSVSGTHALAMVRLDRAAVAVDKDVALQAGGVPITVDPVAIEVYRTSAAAQPAAPGPL